MRDLNSFSFILIGDTHGDFDDFKKIREIIEQVEPEYVLSEQLQDKKLRTPEEYGNFKSDNKQLQQLVALCHEKKIILEGIDLKDFGFDNRLQEVIQGKRAPTTQEESEIAELVERRSRLHVQRIKEYSSKKPLVAIVGAWHLRDGAPLRTELKNYCAFLPITKEGKRITSPGAHTQMEYEEVYENS